MAENYELEKEESDVYYENELDQVEEAEQHKFINEDEKEDVTKE